MVKRLIFVSCGQMTEQEKELGKAIKEVIDATDGFEAYFAESVHDLDSLARNIFEGLRRCSGAIAVLHNRGKVQNWGIRSSVWVNQELAILAYRQFLEATPVPLYAFIERDVKLEGAMTALMHLGCSQKRTPDALLQISTGVHFWVSTEKRIWPGAALTANSMRGSPRGTRNKNKRRRFRGMAVLRNSVTAVVIA